MLAGTLITSFLDVPFRTFLPTDVNFVDLIVMVVNFPQPLNAVSPIFVIFLPTVTLVSFFAFANAFFATVVTLYVSPFTLTVAGTETVFFVLTFLSFW